MFVGIGEELFQLRRDSGARLIAMRSTIQQIVAAPRFTTPRLIFSLDEGGVVLYDWSLDAEQTMFAITLAAPKLTLTRDGHLVAASDCAIEVYSTSTSTHAIEVESRNAEWSDSGDGCRCPPRSLCSH
jgi:hypothetical protein